MKRIIGLATVALLASLNAQANPVTITGEIEFFGVPVIFTSQNGVGTPLDEDGNGFLGCMDPVGPATSSCIDYEEGPATGASFDGLLPLGGTSLLSSVTYSTGSILTDYGIGIGDSAVFHDFDLNTVSAATPALEWVVNVAATPLTGIMEFFITSGSETDTSTPGFWDLAGTGYFKFTCDTTECEDTTTQGTWTLSNSGGFTISATNAVPAPSALVVLGLGLLGLGAIRRRRQQV